MPVKTFFRYSARSVLAALGAALLTTVTAMDMYPQSFRAADTCTRQEVSQWQLSMSDRDPFAEAAQFLDETETFLQNCPNRPETKLAQTMAGLLAVRVGDAERARHHFEAGQPLETVHAKFAYITSLLALGQSQKAWAARDEMIDTWLKRLQPETQIRIEDLPDGRLIEVSYDRPNPQTGVQIVWLAVPKRAGWPAAVSGGIKREMTTIRLISNDRPTPRLTHIDMYRCRGRRFLSQPATALKPVQFAHSARAVLTGYLRAPDMYQTAAAGSPLKNCYWPNRLMPD